MPQVSLPWGQGEPLTVALPDHDDYTRWQRSLWSDKDVEEISQAAMAVRRAAPRQS